MEEYIKRQEARWKEEQSSKKMEIEEEEEEEEGEEELSGYDKWKLEQKRKWKTEAKRIEEEERLERERIEEEQRRLEIEEQMKDDEKLANELRKKFEAKEKMEEEKLKREQEDFEMALKMQKEILNEESDSEITEEEIEIQDERIKKKEEEEEEEVEHHPLRVERLTDPVYPSNSFDCPGFAPSFFQEIPVREQTEMDQKKSQEEEDRRMAMELQKQFIEENRNEQRPSPRYQQRVAPPPRRSGQMTFSFAEPNGNHRHLRRRFNLERSSTDDFGRMFNMARRMMLSDNLMNNFRFGGNNINGGQPRGNPSGRGKMNFSNFFF